MDSIGYFLLSQFIWAVTFGFYHVLFSLIAMFLLFVLWERLPFIPSVILSIGAHVVAVLTLFVIAKIGVIDLWDYQYAPFSYESIGYNPWIASLSLALTYAFIQSIFFLLLSIRFSWLHKARPLLVALVSNLMAAVLVYKLLPAY